jgi:hypothetical protein
MRRLCGPTYFSDNWNTDFHGDVSNAEENYYDVVNHLYYNQIRGAALFADRGFISPSCPVASEAERSCPE